MGEGVQICSQTSQCHSGRGRNKFDQDMTSKLSYEKFIEETFKPPTRHSSRPVRIAH